MASYPTTDEIVADLGEEEIADRVAALSTWQSSPITLASLSLTEVTPEILAAWAKLAAAIRQLHKDATVTTSGEVRRPQTYDELRDRVIGAEQSKRYTAALEAEKAAAAEAKKD